MSLWLERPLHIVQKQSSSGKSFDELIFVHLSFIGRKLHNVRTRRRNGSADSRTGSSYDSWRNPWRGTSKWENRSSEESSATSTATTSTTDGNQQGEARTRGHSTSRRKFGSQQKRSALLQVVRHQLQLLEHVHCSQEVLLLESCRRGEQQQQ